MAAPKDADEVLGAVRLGWFLAEVRGRNRLDPPTAVEGSMPDRSGSALPLRAERSATEQRIAAQLVLAKLAADLHVDDDPQTAGAKFGTAIDSQAKVLNDSRNDSEWASFADLVYRFDCHIQDTLMAVSEQQACGYLLGRGLAETYWALDPNADVAPPRADSWSFLLGAERREELVRLLGRLAPYMNALSAPAISGSLTVWNNVAKTKDWREQPGAGNDLYAQTRRWYELVVLGQDPKTLVEPFAMVRHFRTTLKALELFLPQLFLGALSVAALVGFIWLTAAGGGTNTGKAVLGVVGSLGLSVTALQTKVKSTAQSLARRLQTDAYIDLITVAITVVPLRTTAEVEHRKRLGSATQRAVTSALRGRELTAAVDM